VALVVFGPRRIPEMARKAGKLLHEFRQVSNEFKSTWENEVKLDEDEKSAFDFSEQSIAREKTQADYIHPAELAEKEAESARENADSTDATDATDATDEDIEFKNQSAKAAKELTKDNPAPEIREVTDQAELAKIINDNDISSDKTNWL
jgi:sec-independent protein translocase protein TatB